jgi:histidinol-phosphate aminotransferase
MSPATPRPGLRDVQPYEAPQLDVRARLNTNECPYPLPQAFREELGDLIRGQALNRYPDREAVDLRTALAEHAGHPLEGTWAANGSNEIIEQLLLAYAGPGRRVVVFEPTYLLHRRLAWLTHSEVERVELEPPWRIHADDMVRKHRHGHPAVVFVCSPNNPTGNAQDAAIIAAAAEMARNELFVVDEAYIEFGGASMLPHVGSLPNLVVVRTFSKAFALAGARIGYCLASPEVVEDLRRVRLPYHLSTLTQAAGLAALRHAGDARSILGRVREQRDRILEALPALGVEAFPSEANFVLFRPPESATEVWTRLLERGVLVRDLTAVVPGCLRVTAGTPAEVDLFLSALEEVLT